MRYRRIGIQHVLRLRYWSLPLIYSIVFNHYCNWCYYQIWLHWVHSLCLDYFVCVRSCIIAACMLYYCNTVRRAWLDWGLSGWLTTLIQCFDTVGWVIRPVKTVGRITYIVLVQTLNHAQSICNWCSVNVLMFFIVLYNCVYFVFFCICMFS